MEVDNEVSGNGNSYTTEFRQYDPRLGRWKSLDPLMMKYPMMSPYVAFNNNPIYYIDPLGLEGGPGDVQDIEGVEVVAKSNNKKLTRGPQQIQDPDSRDPEPIRSFEKNIPNDRKLGYYSYDTDSHNWSVDNDWRLKKYPEFKKAMNGVGAAADNQTKKLKSLGLRSNASAKDVGFGQFDYNSGYVLSMYYRTSKGRTVEIAILFAVYNGPETGNTGNAGGNYSNQESEPLFAKPSLSIQSADAIENELSNCYTTALGIYGHIGVDSEFKKILDDDFTPVNYSDVKVGDVAHIPGNHAMVVIGKANGVLTFKSNWNGSGIMEGTFSKSVIMTKC